MFFFFFFKESIREWRNDLVSISMENNKVCRGKKERERERERKRETVGVLLRSPEEV